MDFDSDASDLRSFLPYLACRLINIFRGKFYTKMLHLFYLKLKQEPTYLLKPSKSNAFKPVTGIFNLLTSKEKKVFYFFMMELQG